MSKDVSFRAWRSGELVAGTHLGTGLPGHALAMLHAVGTRAYADPHAPGASGTLGAGRPRTYEWAAWVGPVVEPGHPFRSLIPSWNARTPADSWLEVEARTSHDGLAWSRWYSLGRWAESATEIRPATTVGQADRNGRVSHDVLTAVAAPWSAYQLRVTLLRCAGSHAVPEVSLVGALVSAQGRGAVPSGDPGGVAHGVELAVPAYSQQVHRGEFPQWDNGGESWCSPTSTTMVLGRWGLGPSEEEYAWVDPGYADRFVGHAACHVFDHAYGGAGNWSFNTAYAARYGAEAFVTRLRSLAEAELFIASGIPLVASVAFAEDDMTGAGYGTDGHLLTIVGFDVDGAVISNDPASHQKPSNDAVRVVYDRAQFERAWQGAAGGLVYVIRPPDVPLPTPAEATQPNW